MGFVIEWSSELEDERLSLSQQLEKRCCAWSLNKLPLARTLREALAAKLRRSSFASSQRKWFFKHLESSDFDDELFVERLSELKAQHDQLERRKTEAEGQLADSMSDPIPPQLDPTIEKHFLNCRQHLCQLPRQSGLSVLQNKAALNLTSKQPWSRLFTCFFVPAFLRAPLPPLLLSFYLQERIGSHPCLQ